MDSACYSIESRCPTVNEPSLPHCLCGRSGRLLSKRAGAKCRLGGGIWQASPLGSVDDISSSAIRTVGPLLTTEKDEEEGICSEVSLLPAGESQRPESSCCCPESQNSSPPSSPGALLHTFSGIPVDASAENELEDPSILLSGPLRCRCCLLPSIASLATRAAWAAVRTFGGIDEDDASDTDAGDVAFLVTGFPHATMLLA
mmetsp:Transcript_67593/g.117652  ORF Transcript_67593/g.117652 Transcript_67593/m.117652 type:complete len:201 (-) Transcript_67593:1002-1604(-)